MSRPSESDLRGISIPSPFAGADEYQTAAKRLWQEATQLGWHGGSRYTKLVNAARYCEHAAHTRKRRD